MCLSWVSTVLIVSVLRETYGISVSQTEGSRIISQGHPVLLNCSYETSFTAFPFWYVQYPTGPPRLFLRGTGREDGDMGIAKGFSATHDEQKKTFHLWKPSSELSDSATYYCAANDGINSYKLSFGKGTRLLVKPNLPESEPSIYQLKSEDGKFSACLITDFAPGDISVGSSGSEPKAINGSIVQVKNPDNEKTEASYGTVLWEEHENFGCFATHRTKDVNMSDSDEEGDTCRITELDDNFETDEKLNLLSFTLLGLRIVFVKGVAVNLLLTFWLWKS